MKDISIIIVSYNTKEFLLSCLTSISKPVPKSIDYEVIVVDNNSQDNTVNEVKEMKGQPSGLKVIANKKNFGFSKGNNIGVHVAKGRYLLFLNADTLLKEDVIQHMLSFMESHKDTGAATCVLRMPNGKIDDATHRGFPTPWNAFCYFSGLAKLFPKSLLFNGYNLGWQDLDAVHEIDALAGAFMLVRREAGEDVHWWDEDYFFYGEDLDFCYQLKQRGWKIYYIPDVEIVHFKGVSGGIKKESQHITKADSETRLRAMNARFDAMRIFYKKHYVKTYPTILTWIVLQGITFKQKMAMRKI